MNQAGTITAPEAATADLGAPNDQGKERRILALDGIRGVACILVIVSHFFGEVPHGVKASMVGWVGVDIFFVLSGFLIGRLILEKKQHANFFSVFYVRRFWRIIPAYVLTVLAVSLLVALCPPTWSDAHVRFPVWTYLAFLQGFWMTSTNSIGAHWLAPTWTLAVEEHFYLLAPVAIVFMPRRRLIGVLSAVCVAAAGLRGAALVSGPQAYMAGLALLPGRADLLAYGILAAFLFQSGQWRRFLLALRWAPLVALVLTSAIGAASAPALYILGPTIIGIGSACLILCLAGDAPEAATFKARTLRFFGDNAYCLYLVHLPVLGLTHGLLLGATPELERTIQWPVTVAALLLSVLIGWAMTKTIEEPLTRYGRRWAWSGPKPAP